MDFMDFMGGGEISLDLTNTADLTAWLSKYNGSYACGDDWSVADFEGIYKPVRDDIAPYYGARRVENLCLWSRDISATGWSGQGVVTGTNLWVAEGSGDRKWRALTTQEGHYYRISFDAYVVPSGGNLENYKIYHESSASGALTVIPFLSYTKQRYSTIVLGRVGGGSIYTGLRDYNTSNFSQVYLSNFHFEDVTGQANQNPSEHIPTTSSAVTKYFNYENGNTVDANYVVTEARGADLTNTIGLAFHPSTTNVIASGVYRDFTNAAWTKTNGSITTGAVTLIDGTSVSDKNTFTASAANGTIIHDPYVSASGVHSGGVFIKRKTGTGDIEVTIDGGTTWVDVTSQVDGGSGWHLCQTTLPTVTDPEFGVRLVTSGDAVYLDWAQLDDGFARVSAHPIKGGVTLSDQSFTAADAADVGKLVKDKQGYIIVECQLLPDDLGLLYGKIVNRNAFVDNTEMLQLVPSTGLKSVDLGGNHLTVSSGAFSGLSKVASYWWDANKQLSMNGSSSPVGTYSGSWGSDLMAIGGKQWTAYQFNGIISKITFGVGIKTTQTKMEEATT